MCAYKKGFCRQFLWFHLFFNLNIVCSPVRRTCASSFQIPNPLVEVIDTSIGIPKKSLFMILDSITQLLKRNNV